MLETFFKNVMYCEWRVNTAAYLIREERGNENKKRKLFVMNNNNRHKRSAGAHAQVRDCKRERLFVRVGLYPLEEMIYLMFLFSGVEIALVSRQCVVAFRHITALRTQCLQNERKCLECLTLGF